MTIKTVNRGLLLRRAKAGLLEAKCNYSLTDDYAYDAANNFGKMSDFKPIVIREQVPVMCGDVQQTDQWGEPRFTWSFEEGKVNLFDDAFKGPGRAWENNDGTITLAVHSNLSYTLRIKEAEA